jgi:protein-S-isoprenylcysteine O-methyltransferase Ste14
VTSVFAWVGGALFAVSLLYTGYFYAWVLGNPTPADARPLGSAALVNVTLFGLFAGHHSLFAREAVKRWLARVIPAHLERSTYVWIASVLLLAALLPWQLVDGMVYRIDGPARWLFHALQLAGVYLTMRAASAIDPLELAGIRQSARQTAAMGLRTDGAFGLVRHPIYLGWMLIAFAAPSMTVNRMMFAVITSVYLIAAIPWEEASLVSAFGERYRTYQRRVRWRLIPGVW